MASALPVYFVVSYTRLFFIPVLLSFHLLDQFYQPGCVCQIVRLHRARIAVCLLDGIALSHISRFLSKKTTVGYAAARPVALPEWLIWQSDTDGTDRAPCPCVHHGHTHDT